jgi:EPS-associated MarR family transcriptional regulator
VNQEANYRLLKLLETHPEASQREIASELGVSLGKVNYCLRALIDKGHVKAENFRKSNNKAAYLYLLTPTGIQAKARITAHYLQSKLDEYEALQAEIEELQAEVSASDS